MNNAFAGYGCLVTGERLVGRNDDLDRLVGRLERFAGSVSVVGEQRIGKSSLARGAMGSLTQGTVRGLWLTLSAVPSLTHVYQTLLEETEGAPVAGDELYTVFRALRGHLRRRRRAGHRTVLFLDEFDAVVGYPQDARPFTQQLRELIQFQDDTGFMCVFISRRTLYHLERQLPGVSNLDGVCEKLYLRPLRDEGLRKMWDRCGEYWIPSAKDQEDLYMLSGGQPYLAEMILCRGWDTRSVETGLTGSRSDIFQHYQRLRDLLEEDGLFRTLLGVAVGPRIENNIEGVARLCSYGILREAARAEGGLVGWSDHFQAYLEMVAREIPLHDEWRQVETGLRDMIQRRYASHHGANWVGELRRSCTKADEVLARAMELRSREHRSFGLPEDRPLLAYTYPMDLWALITCNWPLFEPAMRHDRTYWGSRFEVLARVRTSLGHTREEHLPESVLRTASGYCKELLEVLARDTG